MWMNTSLHVALKNNFAKAALPLHLIPFVQHRSMADGSDPESLYQFQLELLFKPARNTKVPFYRNRGSVSVGIRVLFPWEYTTETSAIFELTKSGPDSTIRVLNTAFSVTFWVVFCRRPKSCP
jgi:hypothetical protein